MLLLATVWIGSRSPQVNLSAGDIDKINQNMSVLENYDVISDFAPLSELPPPVQADEAGDTNQNQQMEPRMKGTLQFTGWLTVLGMSAALAVPSVAQGPRATWGQTRQDTKPPKQ